MFFGGQGKGVRQSIGDRITRRDLWRTCESGVPIHGVDRFREIALGDRHGCRASVRHGRACGLERRVIEYAPLDRDIIAENIPLIDLGFARGISVHECVENDSPECDNARDRSVPRRIEQRPAAGGNETPKQLSVLPSRLHFRRDLECGCRCSIRIRRRWGRSGVIANHRVIRRVEPGGRERKRPAVDLKRRRKSWVEVLPVGDQIAEAEILEREVVRDLESDGVFKGRAGNDRSAADNRDRLLSGNRAVVQYMGGRPT